MPKKTSGFFSCADDQVFAMLSWAGLGRAGLGEWLP